MTSPPDGIASDSASSSFTAFLLEFERRFQSESGGNMGFFADAEFRLLQHQPPPMNILFASWYTAGIADGARSRSQRYQLNLDPRKRKDRA